MFWSGLVLRSWSAFPSYFICWILPPLGWLGDTLIACSEVISKFIVYVSTCISYVNHPQRIRLTGMIVRFKYNMGDLRDSLLQSHLQPGFSPGLSTKMQPYSNHENRNWLVPHRFPAQRAAQNMATHLVTLKMATTLHIFVIQSLHKVLQITPWKRFDTFNYLLQQSTVIHGNPPPSLFHIKTWPCQRYMDIQSMPTETWCESSDVHCHHPLHVGKLHHVTIGYA